MYNYDKLLDLIYDKIHYVKTKDGYEYRGLLMNYYNKNIIMFTEWYCTRAIQKHRRNATNKENIK